MSICRSVNRKRFDECFRQVSNKEAVASIRRARDGSTPYTPRACGVRRMLATESVVPSCSGQTKKERTNHDSRRRLSRDCNHLPHDG